MTEMHDEFAARLATVNPGDWGKGMDINHAFKVRQLKARKLFAERPPDFRSQLVSPPTEQHAAVTDYFNPAKGNEHD